MAILVSLMICLLLLFFFFILSKNVCSDFFQSSSFECGFSSYYFSRESFSIHCFFIGLLFLFLDLEICVMFFLLYSFTFSLLVSSKLFFFCLILLLGLIMEIKNSKVEWFD